MSEDDLKVEFNAINTTGSIFIIVDRKDYEVIVNDDKNIILREIKGV